MKKDKVLCHIKVFYLEVEQIDEQVLWMDIEPINRWGSRIRKEIITPVIDLPHSDKENGQEEIHYHIDSRYTNQNPYTRIEVLKNSRFEYRYLYKLRDNHTGHTPVKLISKSKLKHKCIYKGKCPHRGYDLTKELPDKNGIITCPLHGLRFNKDNKLITNHDSTKRFSILQR